MFSCLTCVFARLCISSNEIIEIRFCREWRFDILVNGDRTSECPSEGANLCPESVRGLSPPPCKIQWFLDPRLTLSKTGLDHWERVRLAHAGDTDLIPGSGRSPGEGNGNALPYSCLENLMDRVCWRATVQGVTRSQTQLRTQGHGRLGHGPTTLES